MSTLVHNMKEYLNITAIALERGERHCNFLMKCLWLCWLQKCPRPQCCGVAEVLKRWCLAWVCMFRLTAEVLPLTLHDLSRSWQKSCRSNFLHHGGSCQLGMRFAKARLWFGHAGLRSVFLLNWSLDKLKAKKHGTWFRGFKSRPFIPYFQEVHIWGLDFRKFSLREWLFKELQEPWKPEFFVHKPCTAQTAAIVAIFFPRNCKQA